MNNENKNYPQTKVYFDGSHYVGIPKDNFPHGKSYKRKTKHTLKNTTKTPVQEKFDIAYKESQSLPKKKQKTYIIEQMKDTFSSDTATKNFVEQNIERKKINAPCGTNTKHKAITVIFACHNAVNKLITLSKKESFIMTNNNCPEVINMTAPESLDVEEYEKEWQKVDETIEKMHLTQVQYETLSCYIAGMRFEEIVRMYGVVESTVWSRRQKVKNNYLKFIVNGQN